MIRLVGLFTCLIILAGCEPAPKVFQKDSFPSRLSEWGVLRVDGGELVVHSESTTYDLNTPLFTDYAHKLRTVWTPPESSGAIADDGEIQLPVGSIISKTFYYPSVEGSLSHLNSNGQHNTDGGLDMRQVHLMETRLLVHLEDGWHGLPYIWNAEQTDASLEITGDVIPVSIEGLGDFNYVVPDFNQCQGCHVTDLAAKEIGPIGLKVRHINKTFAGPNANINQLESLAARHQLSGLQDLSSYPANADAKNEALSLAHRARSYLDINCGHCHNPKGAADTSGMFLNIEESNPLPLGVCKPPIAAGQGTGGFLFGISPGDGELTKHIFVMRSRDPGAMMPELGRSLVHEEGVRLVTEWIDAMEGSCTDS